MKKTLLAFVVGFSLIGCSISEQIIFNADGSGKLAYTVDMSKMLVITKDLDKSNKMTKELTEGTDKDMDSTIVFKDMAAKYEKEGKKATAEQLAHYEQMKNYSMRIVVNKAKSEMKYIMYTDFKTISEAGNVGSVLSTMKDLSGKKTGALDAANPGGNTEVKYVFDAKSFSRTVVEKPYVESQYDEEVIDSAAEIVDFDYESMDTLNLKDKEIESSEVSQSDEVNDMEYDEEVSEEEEEMSKEEIKKMNKEFEKMGEMMKEGLEDSTFDFQYTFAKKIKKVSLPKSNYKLSDDKKTIFIKYKFDEFTKKIKELNLNIEFE
ncbi:hypothetical protein [Flavobacterium terrigena]|uniref:Uncharacterized protein n=1 Tax=Flavobacterium terrigena TaxID=402734 RepID=A0A1H6RZ66_9FLAO|nr:hypothetical protein [Flavobacterium terrigena]SEI60981.1 hypothetical protein SAMN05660918_1134 [Flavobacterium terrigena]